MSKNTDKLTGTVWFSEAKRRWMWEFKRVRPNGTWMRRGPGCAMTEAGAVARLRAANHEWIRDQGVERDAERAKKRERADNLTAWTNRILPVIKRRFAPTTYDKYDSAMRRHVLPAIGKMPLEDIKPVRLEELFVSLAAESYHVASSARTALMHVLDAAVRDGHIPSNPAAIVKLDGRDKKLNRIQRKVGNQVGKRWLTVEEGRHLLATCRGMVGYPVCLFGLRFGMRSGECIGLEPGHIDLKAKVVRVRQQLQYSKHEGVHICPPKSAAGVRDIPIPSDLLDELTALKAEAAGRQFVCVDELGERFHPSHVSRVVKDCVEAAGFNGEDGKPVPTHHDFRSSWGTWLANVVGIKPHILRGLMGHEDISVTYRFYIGTDADDMATAVDSLDWSKPSKLDAAMSSSAA